MKIGQYSGLAAVAKLHIFKIVSKARDEDATGTADLAMCKKMVTAVCIAEWLGW